MKSINDTLIATVAGIIKYILGRNEAVLLSGHYLESITWNCPKESWKHLPVAQAGTCGKIAHLKPIKIISYLFLFLFFQGVALSHYNISKAEV